MCSNGSAMTSASALSSLTWPPFASNSTSFPVARALIRPARAARSKSCLTETIRKPINCSSSSTKLRVTLSARCSIKISSSGWRLKLCASLSTRLVSTRASCAAEMIASSSVNSMRTCVVNAAMDLACALSACASPRAACFSFFDFGSFSVVNSVSESSPKAEARAVKSLRLSFVA